MASALALYSSISGVVHVRREGGEAADVGTGDVRPERGRQRRVEEQVAGVLVTGEVALAVDEGLQRRLRAGAADHPEVAVDLVGVGQLLDERRVVGRAERREHAGDDVAADGAEVGDEAGRRRPAEAVVVGDHRHRAPAGLVVQAVAEPGVPLRAVAVEAEVVLRLHLQRRLLRTGDAVDERHLGMVLGVVGDGDRLVARQRTDDDLGVRPARRACAPPG